jgi:8-oxo-dGTP diphosphatase
MTEDDFLANYDPTAFARPSVTVDLVLMSMIEGVPAALLRRREEHPFLGKWALPGGFVGIDEGLDDAARRLLGTEARLGDAYIEQLYTFGAPDRDPRTRVVTIAYFALLPADRFAAALKQSAELTLAELIIPWPGEAGGPVTACDDDGASLPLAFDHADILGLAIKRLRGKLDYSPIAFALLPELFTLRQLQDVHEAIVGVRLNKPAFRRRMLDRGWLEPTGEREEGTSFRPAELYRFKPID